MQRKDDPWCLLLQGWKISCSMSRPPSTYHHESSPRCRLWESSRYFLSQRNKQHTTNTRWWLLLPERGWVESLYWRVRVFFVQCKGTTYHHESSPRCRLWERSRCFLSQRNRQHTTNTRRRFLFPERGWVEFLYWRVRGFFCCSMQGNDIPPREFTEVLSMTPLASTIMPFIRTSKIRQ